MLLSSFKGINSEKLFSVNGKTNWSEGSIKFQQDIKHLLETPVGSMLGNLNYGSNLYQILFLPISESTGVLIQEEIKRVIEANYVDIKVPYVDVTFEKNTVYVSIGVTNGNSDIIDYINIDFERSGE